MKAASLFLASFLVTCAAAHAQDVSQQKAVDPAAVQVAPVAPQGEPPAAPLVIPPSNQRVGARDAITNQPVSDDRNPMRQREEQPSLRDQVRSKMH